MAWIHIDGDGTYMVGGELFVPGATETDNEDILEAVTNDSPDWVSILDDEPTPPTTDAKPGPDQTSPPAERTDQPEPGDAPEVGGSATPDGGTSGPEELAPTGATAGETLGEDETATPVEGVLTTGDFGGHVPEGEQAGATPEGDPPIVEYPQPPPHEDEGGPVADAQVPEGENEAVPAEHTDPDPKNVQLPDATNSEPADAPEPEAPAEEDLGEAEVVDPEGNVISEEVPPETAPEEAVADDNGMAQAEEAVADPAPESGPDYESQTVEQLQDVARDRDLSGYSSLNKADLIALIEESDNPA